MAQKLLESQRVDGPNGRYVRVSFYDDGSIRFRITSARPMVIKEAFMGGVDKHVIVTMAPRKD